MIYRARTVLTMDGAPIENGAVAVKADRVVDVGRDEEVRARRSGPVTDLGEVVLLPGLINAHCHLDYTLLRGVIPPQRSFTAWIQSINERKASLTPEDYVRSIEAGFAEAAEFGTTTMANLAAFPELIPRISDVPVRTWWFAEMIDVRAAVSGAEVLANLQRAVQDREDHFGGVGLAPHAPYTASHELYAEAAALAAEWGLPLTTHLAESAEEMQMFSEGDGALFDFMNEIGRSMDDCDGMTPVGMMLKREVLNGRWIVAHLNELRPADLSLLGNAPRFHIAHCPRSHGYFGHAPFLLRELRALGFNLCLGTDSLASNADLSLFAEMREVRRTLPSLPAVEILRMATANGAAALGQGEMLGRLRVGYLADMIGIPSEAAAEDVFEEIIDFTGPVPWRMVNGRATHRS